MAAQRYVIPTVQQHQLMAIYIQEQVYNEYGRQEQEVEDIGPIPMYSSIAPRLDPRYKYVNHRNQFGLTNATPLQ